MGKWKPGGPGRPPNGVKTKKAAKKVKRVRRIYRTPQPVLALGAVKMPHYQASQFVSRMREFLKIVMRREALPAFDVNEHAHLTQLRDMLATEEQRCFSKALGTLVGDTLNEFGDTD